MNKPFVMLLLCMCCCDARATTWGSTTVEDPILAGEECHVMEPASYGSYIYHWESKYDQVFWPLVEKNGIWFCKKSGFTAFIGDFDGLTEGEREEIQTYLRENYSGGDTIEERLKLLEQIYSRRKKDDSFRNMLLRVLARWNQELGNLEEARRYRRLALTQIHAKLTGELPGQERLEYLYLACNYDVYFELRSADDCVAEVKAALKEESDPELGDYVDYLEALIEETPRIKPGGKLDPENVDA